MAEMTKAEIEQIIKDYLSTRQIELKDFTTISGVDGTTYVLLVQPTGTANKMDVNLLKKQLVAEIKEPADVVIKEVEKAGQDAAAAVEAATKAVGEANTAATNANEAANTAKQAALNVKDGKTPVFGTVTAKGGDKAAATYKLNGVDANGSPKYDVAFVLEKGADGKHPVLQSGNITTLAPNEQVKASFRANGYDSENRPIYLVDLAIPKGNKGDAGDGSGNVLVNPSGLKKDARYLFVPKADGSADGAFVEAKTSLITNDSKFQTDEDVKSAIDAVEYSGRNLLLNSGRKIKENTYNLVSYLISEPIADGEEVTITVKGKTGEGKYPYFMAYNTFGSHKIADVAKFKDGGYYAATTKWIVGGANTHVIIYAPPSSVISESEIEWVMLTRGNKPATDWSPAPEDLTAHQDFMAGSSTITTLTSIPADKRTILATLGAATNITLKKPLEVGKELLISINPTADFEQPLPVSNGWQSLDGDTLSLKAGKLAELSILCVDNDKYVLSSKVAE